MEDSDKWRVHITLVIMMEASCYKQLVCRRCIWFV